MLGHKALWDAEILPLKALNNKKTGETAKARETFEALVRDVFSSPLNDILE